ncbi:hypothetical protein caldi_24450 [Caldinitratiruptor microaerophilus]|uniref:tRNA (Adenine22-N1)-methyltransferase n=1 Tax=Caldinitratiruptor microaerophilus TaxID=671077 RepID=A0AA35G8S9_9FIRM|nr:hypothetical protein caldi_24450 [Caldinitratiruptor microaerophilus]
MAGFVLPGRPVADIGTDHGLLPAYLVVTGRVPRAIATDLRPGPLEAARRTLRAAGVEDRVELRRGDGFAALRPGEVATAVVAGMGGAHVAELVARAGQALDGVGRLVLQPRGAEEVVRRTLAALGWGIVDEALVADGRHIYVVLAAERAAQPPALSEEDALLGPVLRRRGGKLFRRYVARHRDRLQEALAGARRARDPDPGYLRRLAGQLRILEEALADEERRDVP